MAMTSSLGGGPVAEPLNDDRLAYDMRRGDLMTEPGLFPSTSRLQFGGDYNPEQWEPAVWDEDVQLMRRAGVTVATVGVFSWSRLEPRPGEYDFTWLDDVLDRLHAGGIDVM